MPTELQFRTPLPWPVRSHSEHQRSGDVGPLVLPAGPPPERWASREPLPRRRGTSHPMAGFPPQDTPHTSQPCATSLAQTACPSRQKRRNRAGAVQDRTRTATEPTSCRRVTHFQNIFPPSFQLLSSQATPEPRTARVSLIPETTGADRSPDQHDRFLARQFRCCSPKRSRAIFPRGRQFLTQSVRRRPSVQARSFAPILSGPLRSPETGARGPSFFEGTEP